MIALPHQLTKKHSFESVALFYRNTVVSIERNKQISQQYVAVLCYLLVLEEPKELYSVRNGFQPIFVIW